MSSCLCPQLKSGYLKPLKDMICLIACGAAPCRPRSLCLLSFKTKKEPGVSDRDVSLMEGGAYTSEARSRVTPLCEANSERDMVAVFTPEGKGRLLVTGEIDIRWAQGKQQRGMPLTTPLISMITSWVLGQVSRNVSPVSRV